MVIPLVFVFIVQTLAWAWVAAGLRRVREATVPLADAACEGPALPLSVIVAAHDEEDRLPALLDALETQTHRPFEVIVVDDRSTDGTAHIVEDRARQWAAAGGPEMRLVGVEPEAPEAVGLPPKKYALERGVEASRHARLAFTDADGRPPPTWMAALAHHASPAGSPDEGAVLIGYGPYAEAPGWLNRFVRYETVQTAVLAAAAVGWGRPWHAVGRNLSYPRALLDRLGGFEHSAASLSGDDDLLVQEVARRCAAPVRFVWDADAAVPSPAPPTWRAFWRQKRRHASAGAHYPAGVLAALGVFHTSNLALWVGAPLLHALTGSPVGWGLLAAKLLLQRTTLAPAFDTIGAEGDIRLGQPVLDALSALYHAALAVLGALPTPRRW